MEQHAHGITLSHLLHHTREGVPTHTMKILFPIIGIVVIVALIVFFMRNGKPHITNYPPEEGAIVAFGDSLVEGIGASDGGDFVSLLEEKTGEPIVNLGRSGDTTESAKLRLESVLKENPRIVIVLLGGNDVIRRVPAKDTFQNLRYIIETIHESGAVVLLVGIQGGVLRDSHRKEFRRIVREHGTAYVPDILQGIIGNPEYMFDAIHPNDKGHAIMADRMYEKLAPLLSP